MKFLCAVIGASALLYCRSVLPQASLAAENIVDAVSVSVKKPDGSKEEQVFTLVRDSRNADQWYYFPNQPRISEIIIDQKRIPELTFIRFTSSTNDGQINSGGLLTFSITLGAAPDAIQGMKEKLADYLKKSGQPSNANFRLSPIPLNSASAAVYSPTTGNLIAEGGANSVVAPVDNPGATNASSKVVFALMLTDVGSDIYEKLLNGSAGIPVWVRYKYNGLTPPAGLKVTANWERAYEHYSKNEKFRARASYYGLFSANYASDRDYVRDELLKNGDITVEAIAGGEVKQETLDKYLQPIVKRLNDTLLQDYQPPRQIDPASAPTPGSDGFFGGAGYSVTVKDIKYVVKGKETWDFRFSSIVERGGVADGAVGLLGYPEDVRKSLVQSVDAGNWDRVYFATPNTPRVDSADLRVRLKSDDKIVQERYLKWTERGGWINVQGNQPINGFWISLLSMPGFDRSHAAWETDYTFSVGPYSVKAISELPLEGQAAGVTAPADLVRVITVTAGPLAFDGSDPDKLTSVDVQLSDGARQARQSFTRTNRAGVVGVTSDLQWPVVMQNGKMPEVSAKLVFNYASKPSCSVDVSSNEFATRFISDVIVIPAAKGTCK